LLNFITLELGNKMAEYSHGHMRGKGRGHMRGKGRWSQQWSDRPAAASVDFSGYLPRRGGKKGGQWRRTRGQPWNPANARVKEEFATVKQEPRPTLPTNFRRFMRKKFPAISAEFYNMMSDKSQSTDVIDITSDEGEDAANIQITGTIEIKPEDGGDMDVTASNEEVATSQHKSKKAKKNPKKTTAPFSDTEVERIEVRCRALEQNQQALQQQLDTLRREFSAFEASTNSFISAANTLAASVDDLEI
jgi:hypothetical protein